MFLTSPGMQNCPKVHFSQKVHFLHPPTTQNIAYTYAKTHLGRFVTQKCGKVAKVRKWAFRHPRTHLFSLIKRALAVSVDFSENFAKSFFSQNDFLIFSKNAVHVYKKAGFGNAFFRKLGYFAKSVAKITVLQIYHVYAGFADSGVPKSHVSQKWPAEPKFSHFLRTFQI